MRLFLILATFVGFALYGIALEAPLYLDDYVVLNNAEGLSWGTRGLGYASFWLSHQIASAFGLVLAFQGTVYYRFPNILIHILAATALFWLTRELTGRRLTAGLAGALFLMHPVQTQAVTYITQRFESLAALFMIVGAAAYVRFRNTGDLRWVWIVLIAFYAATRTKETYVAFPFWIALIEMVCISGLDFVRKVPVWIYCALAAGLVAVSQPARMALRGSQQTLIWTPFENYLLTQGDVLFRYLRLVIFPDRQFLLYGIPLSTTITPVLMLKWAVVLAVVGLGVYLCWKKPVVGFGILTFFLMLGPTSIAPLPDLMFEHRLYPGMAGLAMAAACAFEARRRTAVIFSLFLIALGVRTVLRNQEWNDRAAFYEAHRREFPQDSKVLATLGAAYAQRGDVKRAIEVNEDAKKYMGLVNPYYLKSVSVITDTNLGLLYVQSGALKKAREEALRVLAVDSTQVQALSVLANVQEAEGELAQARLTYEKIRVLAPADDVTLKRLAALNSNLGDTRKATQIREDAASIKAHAAVEEAKLRPSPEALQRRLFGLIATLLVIAVLAVRGLYQDLPEVWRWLRTGSAGQSVRMA